MTTEQINAIKQTPSSAEVAKSNPAMTYGQAIGYSIGAAAAALGNKYASLSPEDWLNATDDYAHGYRKGFSDWKPRNPST